MESVAAVFADVHGEAEHLKKLIQKIKEKYPEAELYSLGDLVDRGSTSKEVIQVCIDENIKGIYGNHDQWIRDLVVKQTFDPFCLKPIMGGKYTLDSYGVDFYSDGYDYFPNGRSEKILGIELYNRIPEAHKKWIKELVPYRRITVADQTFWLIHAGLTLSVAGKYQADSDDEMMRKIVEKEVDSILWPSPNLGGGFTKDNLYHFKDAVQIFGHRPVKEPLIKDHFIALDTGCGTCEPFTLSAIILPSKEIIQVSDNEWV